MICTRCGKELPDDSRFCNYCGKRIAANTAPVQRRKRRRPKGAGSVYKLTDGRQRPWVALAKTRVVIGTYNTSAEAVLALDKWNADHKPVDYRMLAFKEVYALWEPGYCKKVTKSTVSAIHAAYKRSAVLYDRPMGEIKTQDYQNVLDQMELEGASLSLVQKQKQLFTMLCTYAMKQDIIDKNYAGFCEISAKEKNPEKNDRVFTNAEIQCIFGYADDAKLGRTARMVLVLLYTGMREDELLQMEKENVLLDEQIMIGGLKTDAGRNREIPIHMAILPYIKEWMVEYPDSIYLTPSAAGTKMDPRNFRRSFYKLMEECNITGVKLHSTRHTTATLLLASGVKPDVIKSILGHAKISTTVDVYDHPDRGSLVSGINMIV